MKLLTFSTLFPNAEQPNHGIFVETRLRYLLASGQVTSRVVAPVPWFPFNESAFRRLWHLCQRARKRSPPRHRRLPSALSR